ncbi:MAG: aspartate aminotransferase family protein [Peptococcaceae bacterium]|nr:aspartate aminotransferase family protein [Peptococcaceae bacterium]
MNTYSQPPIVVTKGRGTWVWDCTGRAYLDFVTGAAVTSLGHSHPRVVKAMEEQLQNIVHTSNLFWNEKQIALGRKLVDHSFADKVFFCNSGAEANEGAFKLARKFAKIHYGESKYQIVSLKNSFHGRTYAALSATGQTKYHKNFDPLLPGFSYVEINKAEALRSAVGPETAAVILEPIQGEGGVHTVNADFIKLARQLCDAFGALLIFDEIQCGLGRTGHLFAHHLGDVTPDIMTLAKALANGAPIGAMLATDRVASAFQPGDHASTFGGNPLVTAAGCAVLDVLTAPGFLEDVCVRASYLKNALQKIADAYFDGAHVRGSGFMLGFTVGDMGPDLVTRCREQGLLINCVGGSTLRFLPPLTVNREEIDEAVSILKAVVCEIK